MDHGDDEIDQLSRGLNESNQAISEAVALASNDYAASHGQALNRPTFTASRNEAHCCSDTAK